MSGLRASRLSLLLLGLTAAACLPTTAAAVPSLSATLTPLGPRAPTLTRVPTPAPDSWPLTDPGCCSRPWWSADGSSILFVDDPPGDEPLGVYGVSPEGGAPALVAEAETSADLAEVVARTQGLPAPPPAEDLPRGARNLHGSPFGDRLAWIEGSQTPTAIDVRQQSVWLLDRGFAAPRRIVTLTGGGLVGWTGDGTGLIVTGKVDASGSSGVWRVPIEGGAPRLLAAGTRPRGALLSPTRRWVVFYLAFEADPTRNGTWLVPTDGGEARSLGGLASYRWGGADRLFLIPFATGSGPLILMGIGPGLDPAPSVILEDAFPQGIAANDWQPSPAGDRIVYRSADEGRLWLLAVPSP